jgi:hypothetical protein
MVESCQERKSRPVNPEPITIPYELIALGSMFQVGDHQVELVGYCSNDFDYCYQGAVVRVKGELYHAQLLGPFETEQEREYEQELHLRLDTPVYCGAGFFWIVRENYKNAIGLISESTLGLGREPVSAQ